MRTLLILVGILAALAWLAYAPVVDYLRERSKPDYQTAKVTRRTLALVVNSTGDVKPVLSVSIGSFVSGPIAKLHVDFNDRVKQGQLLAEIDPRIYDAAVARDRATLVTREAEVKGVQAQLQQAINNENRSIALRKESADYIAQTEIDQFHFARMALEAQLEVTKAGVAQATANLSNSEANLEYTKIQSPVNGIVIDRKIDPGQTLAAQFQTPELFVIAPDMDKTMHVFASVDEADIGVLRRAQELGRPVQFTVDAYPDDLFTGKIEQIRFSSTETQNVVTYPVVVSSPNSDLKLLPGMTADLSFIIEEKKDVLCVPNAALRFYPADKKLVRSEDQVILDGAVEDDDDIIDNASASQKIDAGRERAKRHVWTESAEGLHAIEIVTGINDNKYTEVLSGDLEAGQKLVTDIKSDL